MEVFDNLILSLWCHSNQHCLQSIKEQLSSARESASFFLGLISVIVWVVAEIPQIITNYRTKSTEGLSLTFLVTWIIGDVFNLLGCLLEPATLLTQLYMAVLYTIITLALGLQTIYYGHIYPQLKYRRQLKHSKHEQVETFTKIGQGEKAADAEQSINFENSNRNASPSSPIPLPAFPQRIGTGRELFYRSARYLSKSHTPTAGSILAQRMGSTTSLDSIQEGLLGSAIATQSAPASRMKNTLCLVTTLTFLGAINLLHPLSTNINHMGSNPRQQFVIHVGRKLFQVGDDQLLKTDVSGNSSIGTFLGWAMTFVYLGGRLPQICLNIKRGHAEGLNPLMFMFAVLGNSTYVASILVISLDWSKIKPNLPWLVDAGGCVLLDFLILMQFIYFRYWTSQDL
ncbi:seven transmembrane protein 1 [Vigna radiata var. radiata]|uniref:Seven transmembrane protein 1 n=1 Tax=Vigna radiata var. radiata TaxID=3916 RepID=A0A1S3TB60_VIGRR|nr:seven transmembrane protein 1 [Vigna radiata var. radiata]XP_014491006.1 seven transmembrane protein 1 [Vigna radiata var. radiata]XP_022633413.1 seven transmembrane protein 1 [Vigna radiata var. radiata]XP_022633414.1 seven transmembrane protein 1 [Vigna radiata var. radiata]